MITILRFRFSTGKWGLDFYDKKNAGTDFFPTPFKWSYPVSVDSYPVFPKARARLRRAMRLTRNEEV